MATTHPVWMSSKNDNGKRSEKKEGQASTWQSKFCTTVAKVLVTTQKLVITA